ncbi:MAG: M28 family peptidase [candidate division Zixibacteria bacterium]|nr:M28 family peptidase [candidate division Zixibacteria bacterium]
MLWRSWTIILAAATLTTTAFADDLYKVRISNADQARRLAATGVIPIVRLDDGYLVTATPANQSAIDESGLTFSLVSRNVDRSKLAVDNRLDRVNTSRFPLLWEQGNFRLYALDQAPALYRGTLPEVTALPADPVEISYPAPAIPPSELVERLSPDDVPLATLIGGVVQDSLFSYVNRLQAYFRRPAGTDSNYASRDWIAARFTSFGYDSVVIDSFVSIINGVPTPCQNVLCYKIGTVYPRHQVIVGAHRDGVTTSPAADDNGSGTAGVLEIARALKDVPTDVTMIFSLYDAEEYGLFGSADYAKRAQARGDSIVYMLNMDMIAQAGNSDSANIYHGPALQYSNLWLTLADSLAGITKGVLAGTSGGSDHYPFQQRGYEVSFVQEGIFSVVYHTYRDSTSFMNFEYMTRMVKASLATVYTVSQSFVPAATLVIDYKWGYPVMIAPGTQPTVDVNVAWYYGASVVPGSIKLNYKVENGSWQQVAMISPEIGWFAPLPMLKCFERVQYYVSAQDQTSGKMFYAPAPDNPIKAWAASSRTTVFSDNCETNLGWSVGGNCIDGQWSLGVPVGLGDRGDPPTAFGGTGSCWLTDNVYGNSDVDNGNTTLTSPIFGADSTTRIEYAAWYSNDFGAAPLSDVFRVSISNTNGSSWVQADSIGPTWHAGGGWYVYSIWVRDFVAPTATMRIRFDAADLGSGSVIEAGLDNILIENFGCIPPPCCYHLTGNVDCDPSDGVDISDLSRLIDNLFISLEPLCCDAEANTDGQPGVDISDLSALIDYLFINFTVPAPCQ